MLLKITLKTNLWITVAAIVHALLTIIMTIVNLDHIRALSTFYSVAFYSVMILYPLLDYYLISVLFFFREKKFIVAAFVIYFCLDVFKSLPLLGFSPPLAMTLATGIGMLNFLTLIYMVVASVKISNATTAFPFRLLSISLLIIASTRIVVSVLYPFISRGENGYVIAANLRTMIDYSDLFMLIVPVSVIILANRINRYLAKEVIPAENW
jgi:hypothetical protein